MLASLLKLINNDKFMHFVYGIALYGVFVPFGEVFALVVTMLIAIAKEIYDKNSYGVYEVKDAGATLMGALALFGWYEVINYVQSIL